MGTRFGGFYAAVVRQRKERINERMYIHNRPDIDHSVSVLLHYMTMHKSGVSAEIVQADPFYKHIRSVTI